MIIKRVVVGYLQENCYILEKNGQVLIIDPGDEFNKIDNEINGKVVGVIITHKHFDHVGALKELINKYHVEVNNYDLKEFNFKVLYTPGHSWDSKTYYFENENIMFTGDFIFKGTIGRTDIGGSDKDMIKSLKMIMPYPDDIKIYPGHGDSTILSVEKQNIKSMLDYN